eukprot:3241433-Amphidinium_carterae.1
MAPVKRTSTAWNMCTEDKAVNVDGDWVKVVKDENEQGPVVPKPPPPNAVGTGRWNFDGYKVDS